LGKKIWWNWKEPPTMIGKGKGTAISIHDWTGREGSRRLRLQDFKIISEWRW
jgi:hypothetical protein